MGFFDKISDALMGAGKDVTQRAKDLSDGAKISYDIHSKEDQVECLYAEIGRQYYEEHKDDAPVYEEMDQIKELLVAIEEQKKALLALKGAKVCPRCGKEVHAQDAYCKCCGAKIEEDDIVVDAVVKEAPEAEAPEASEEPAAEKAEEAVEE